MLKLMLASLLVLGGTFAAAPAQAQYNNRGFICTSQNNRYHECSVPFRGRAILTRQLSSASCVEGRSWGQRRGVIWVSRGCRGRFDMVANGAHQGMDPRRDSQNGWNDNNRNNDGRYNDGRYNDSRNNDYSVTCASNDNRMTRCNWDSRYGEPRLVQKLSDSSCDQGRDWGYDDRNSLWVDHGCRARFANR